MNEIILYKSQDGVIKVDVLFENETVWLTQSQMAELFGKGRSTITEHIKNIFVEGELEQEMVCRKFRHATQHGAIEGKTQAYAHRSMYMADWIEHLSMLLTMSQKEMLSHKGKIAQSLAQKKSKEEYSKYQEQQRQIMPLESIKELNADMKRIKAMVSIKEKE